MSLGTLSHNHIFGLKPDVKDGIWFIDDAGTQVLYPAGHNCVIYDTENKSQRFVHGSETTISITALCVSPCKRYLAVAEQAERAHVFIYDLKTLKKRKMLSTPECLSQKFVSLSFSPDSKLLLTQGGAPDWTLVLWQWEQQKPSQSAKVLDGTDPERSVLHCSFNPVDPSMAMVCGHGILKFFRVVDSTFKAMPNPMAASEVPKVTSHAWMLDNPEHVVIGTEDGKLILFHSGTLGSFKVVLRTSPLGGLAITCMKAISRGFIIGLPGGTARVYLRSERSKEFYEFKSEHAMEGGPTVSINSMSVSPSEDFLVAATNAHQLMKLKLSVSDVGGKAEDHAFAVFSNPMHAPGVGGSAAITGMDVCIRKPLIITCGMDRSVRVWNYLDKSSELVKFFTEEAYSVAFHPSGQYCAVGFADKLRILNLLMDDIRQFKELPYKQCREVRFSNGGQYIAAASGTAISIFATYTCDVLHTIRVHHQRIRSLFWSLDDACLISTGADGNVYMWNMYEACKRDGEYVLKSTSYNAAICSADCTSIYVVGNDRLLKEIEFPAANVVKDIPAGVELGQLVLSHSGRMLFAGVAEEGKPGSVRSYKLPLAGADEKTDCQALAAPISRMRISYDDAFLFVAGEDGTLAVFDVKDKDGKAPKRDKDAKLSHSEEILVTKSDLEEKNQHMLELKNKVDELTLHNDYQLRLRDLNYSEKIKDVAAKFTADLERDKGLYETLREEKNDMEMENDEKIKQMEERHQHELQEIEIAYQQKIMAEVDRYQQLVAERDLQTQKWNEAQADLIAAHDGYVTELTEEYESKLEEDRALRVQMQEDRDEMIKEFNETKRQLEQDIDQEIEDLKARYEEKLSGEREATLRFKGENGIMKKKFSALESKIEQQKEEIKSLAEKDKYLKTSIEALETEIHARKKEIRDRDETIGEKEKKIYELKKKNQELEKFKFVLDYKIKELKRQIEPRENEITSMKDQIKEMDEELESYHKSNAQLDTLIGQLRGKLDTMQRDIMKKRQLHNEATGSITKFKNDLHDCVQHIQTPAEMNKRVQALYKLHVQEQTKAETIDRDISREYARQREYLERCVEVLKAKLTSDSAKHKSDNMSLMQMNMALIKEISDTRNQIKTLKMTFAGGSGGKTSKKESLATASMTTGGAAGTISEEALRTIQGQRDELMQLRDKIDSLRRSKAVASGGIHSSVSREKLPPIDGISPRLPEMAMTM